MSASDVPPVEIPKPPPDLIGRDAEFEQVVRFLRGEGGEVLVVSGMPGVGKTRLVMDAVKVVEPGATWLLADDAKALEQQLAQIGAVRKPMNLVLVIDNLDHPASVDAYGRARRGLSGVRRIILTRGQPIELSQDQLYISPLQPGASLSLLMRELAANRYRGPHRFDQLLKVLGGLPPAIHQAAITISLSPFSDPDETAKDFEHGADIDRHIAHARTWNFPNRKYTSWQHSLERALAVFSAILDILLAEEDDWTWVATKMACLPPCPIGRQLVAIPFRNSAIALKGGRTVVQAASWSGLVSLVSGSSPGRDKVILHPVFRAYLRRNVDSNYIDVVSSAVRTWVRDHLSPHLYERRTLWAELDDEREAFVWLTENAAGTELKDWLLSGADYALSRADLTPLWRERNLAALGDPELPEEDRAPLRELLARLGGTSPAPTIDPERMALAEKLRALGMEEEAQKVLDRSASGPSVAPAPAAPARGPVHLCHLSLEDWRGFSTLSLDLPAPADVERGQWLLFLGENGAGKTSLLRALALAMVGDDVAEGLLSHTGLAAPQVRLGAERARIRLHLADRALPDTEIHRTPTSEVMPPRTAPPGGRPFLVAYGCRRGSALGGAAREVEFRPVEGALTLFDERSSLIHAQTWLSRWALARAQNPEGADARFFVSLGRTLEGLLPGVERIEVEPEHVWLSGPGIGRVPLSSLSDGYLTTLGWVLDMVARWAEHARAWKLPLDADFASSMTGIALVDELDLFLHPRWQRDVVGFLRKTFPRMSFVATTHNPLTLLGAREGEIFVVSRAEDGAVRVDRRDLPPGLSADRVLTGDWFGLESTLDADTLSLLTERQRLLIVSARDANQEDRLRELTALLLPRLGARGDTSLERLAETALAEVLAERAPSTPAAPLTPADREDVKERTKALLRRRMSALEGSRGAG